MPNNNIPKSHVHNYYRSIANLAGSWIIPFPVLIGKSIYCLVPTGPNNVPSGNALTVDLSIDTGLMLSL